MATPGIQGTSLSAFSPETKQLNSISPSPQSFPDASSTQRYCLKWNNYQSNVTSTFKELLAVEDFVDITLIAEGGSLKAHKVVLSACSPYFRDILKGISAWQHPVIVLKDVAFVELQGIVEFIYHGEVNVDQASLDSFLKTAQILRVKGLTDDSAAETSGNTDGLHQNRRTLLPQKPHMHHPRKSSHPTRAIFKRDFDRVDDDLLDDSGNVAKRSNISGDEMPIINNETEQKQESDEIDDEESEIDDVEEGDEEEEEVSPMFSGQQPNPSLPIPGQEWDEKKLRQQLLMGGGDLSVVPVGIDLKMFEQSFGLSQSPNLSEESSGNQIASSNPDGGPGASSGAGQKKTCPYCFQQLSWHALSRHIRDMHRAKTGYVTCKFCYKMFRNKNSLGCHMWRFHKDAREQPNNRSDDQAQLQSSEACKTQAI